MDDCSKIRELISPYLDGQLSDEESILLENHVAECRECNDELTRYRVLLSELASLPDVDVPKGFHEAIFFEISNEYKRNRKKSKVNWKSVSAIAASFVMVFFAVGGASSVANNYFVETNKKSLASAVDSDDVYVDILDDFVPLGEVDLTPYESVISDGYRTYSVSITSKMFDDAVSAIANYKGENLNSEMYTTYNSENNPVSNYSISKTVSLNDYNQFVNILSSYGTVTTKQESQTSIHYQIVDAQVRYDAAMERYNRLLSMLDEATEVNSMVFIESSLSNAILEAESYRSQLDLLKQQTQNVYVYVDVVEDVPVTVYVPSDGSLLNRMKNAFLGSINFMAMCFEASVSFVAFIFLPVILVAFFALLIYFVSKKTLRTRRG